MRGGPPKLKGRLKNDFVLLNSNFRKSRSGLCNNENYNLEFGHPPATRPTLGDLLGTCQDGGLPTSTNFNISFKTR